MARIEPRTHIPVQTPSSSDVSSANRSNSVAGALRATPLSKVKEQKLRKRKGAAKDTVSVAANKGVLASDILPLRDRRRDQLMGDLSRIISKLDEMEGADDVSNLCKIMLHEHVRRLGLISGTQVESDGLKGSA